MASNHPCDIQTSGNVLLLEVENLLTGWPTYVIDFTAEQAGPLKLILRLKDASKKVFTEDSDNEDEGGNTLARSYMHRGASIMVEIPNEGAYNQANAKIDVAQAIPVILGGVQKNPDSLKERIIENSDDEGESTFQWPPPRTCHQIPATTSLRALCFVKTFPTSIKPVEN